MEYAIKLETDDGCLYDEGYIKHAGYKENNACIKKYFSNKTAEIISKKVTELTIGVAPNNRPIKVPLQNIYYVMNDVYSSYRPPTGDIFTRYNIRSGETTHSYLQNMIDQTIEIIVSDIKNSFGMQKYNESLTVWTTVLGDFNQHGLTQTPPIKTQNKRPTPFQFHMNY